VDLLLTQVYEHFKDHNVVHCYRKEGYTHDVYKNIRNNRMAIIPIGSEILKDEFIRIQCGWLNIPLPPQFDN